MHRTHKEIGERLAGDWGRDDSGDVDALIKGLTYDQEQVCLLAYIGNSLAALNDKMDLLLDPAKRRRLVAERKAKEERIQQRQAEWTAEQQANREQAVRWNEWLRPYVRARFARLRDCNDGKVFRKVRGCVANTLHYAEKEGSRWDVLRIVNLFKPRSPQDWRVDLARGIGPTHKRRWKALFADENGDAKAKTETTPATDTPS